MYFITKFVISLIGFLAISCRANTSSCERLPNGSLLPHPNDCHRFIICMNGNPIEVDCPENNLFVKTTNGCVPSPIDDCPTGETPPPNIRCPQNKIELLPYPNDCGKFLQCINEHINVYKCPDELHWNQITKYCEKPENANCMSETPPLCDPNEDPMNPTHLPHPTDCTKFYKCEGGFGHIMSCPPGLHWSIYSDRCEYPAVAQCETNNSTNPPGICPENDDPFNPTHLPYPPDCSKFIKCESSIPHIMDCPPGQHWNAAQNYCDYPANAKCTAEILNSNSSLVKEDIDKPIPHKDCPQNEDPSYPTQLPYPNDCSKFYKCLKGIAYPINCPPNLHWSIELNRCDWPYFAKCKTDEPSEPGEGAIPHPSCPPDEDPAKPTHLPYPNDCTKFYKCLKGYAYPMDCPAGLHWSVEKNWCDWPDLAKCEDSVLYIPTQLVKQPTTSQQTTDLPIPHESCPPNENPAKPTHLPYPNDCTKFYKCLKGYAYPMDCPAGLHWSVEKNWCDWPDLAKCEESVLYIPTQLVNQPTTSQQTTDPPIPHESCPPNENPENPTQLPYPNDCTKFYKCLKGYAYPMDCPAGLHWSVEKNWCDWPYLAKCEKKIKKRNIESSLNEKCPKVDDPSHIIRLPNPDDCVLYYECSHSIAILQICPPGTHWSDRLEQCTFPEFAGCDPTIKPHFPFIRPAFSDIVLETENLKNGDDPIQHELCPPNENPENPTQLPYPNDCTKFYKCLKGYAYPMDCPAGLHWSVEKNWCDWPDLAKCEKKIKKRNIESSLNEKCPKVDDPSHIIRLPNPDDCVLYYECSHSIAILQICPPGTHWSVRLEQCTFPEFAGCDPTIKPHFPFIRPAFSDIVLETENLKNGDDPIQHELCPPNENPENPTQLPYPNDCTKFYKCLKGYAYPMDCPARLNWSVEKNWCDWPDIAKCHKNVPHIPTQVVEQPTTLSENEASPVPHKSCPPDENSANPTQLPYPNDCTKFYKCLNGVAYPQKCPAGLEWSIQFNRCDWPDVAECKLI